MDTLLPAQAAAGLPRPERAASPRRDPPPDEGPEILAVPKVGRPYEINGRWYTPAEDPDYDETGIASWYGPTFDGKPTANGETFDQTAITAAHKTLPLPSMVEVTNLDNGRTLTLRVNDRGPFVDGRIIDLSRAAAEELGMLRAGVARVRVRYVGAAPAVTETQIAEATRAPRRSPAPAAPRPPAPALPPPPEPPIELAAAPEPVVREPERLPAPVLAPVSWAVEAGAYPELGGAEQAARRLTTAGAPQIRLVRLDGQVVYQVVISAPSQAAAAAVQQQVVARGFPAARLINP
jgi:rare lipoprotein A